MRRPAEVGASVAFLLPKGPPHLGTIVERRTSKMRRSDTFVIEIDGVFYSLGEEGFVVLDAPIQLVGWDGVGRA